ncbi:uncharacterized protein [Notamacropus eugenii]|uniref:uncharacterized protein n=1 Tax=Notamacropus eugenii TaxID=9315 RepID=UPI003B67E492
MGDIKEHRRSGLSSGTAESKKLSQKTNRFLPISRGSMILPHGAIALPPGTITIPHGAIAVPQGVKGESSGSYCYLSGSTPNIIQRDIWVQGMIEECIDLGVGKIHCIEEEDFQERERKVSRNKTEEKLEMDVERNETVLKGKGREDRQTRLNKENEIKSMLKGEGKKEKEIEDKKSEKGEEKKKKETEDKKSEKSEEKKEKEIEDKKSEGEDKGEDLGEERVLE